MLIDLHMHEKTYSKDSHLTLREMVHRAKVLGLDGICITDHDSMGLRDEAHAYSEAVGFPIFVGIEYYSLQGDIVAFGIEDYPRNRLDAQQFVDCVQRQGGVCFSAHPFRNNRRGLEENLRTVRGLDGVEVLNGSTLPEANQRAADEALALGMALVGASDCHIVEKLGVYATYFPQKISSERELVRGIRRGECRPAYLQDGRYRVWHPGERDFWQEGVTPQRTVEYSELHPTAVRIPAIAGG